MRAVDVVRTLTVPLREWRALRCVRHLWRVEARLQWAYLLRFPAVFIWRERRALQRNGFEDESFLFGETPYDVGMQICAEMRLGPHDVLYDLGCGRGKMVFVAHLFRKCQAIGVDLLPTYVRTARKVARSLRLGGVRFEQEDVLSIPLDDATAVYVNGFTFSDDVAGGLRARISLLEDGTWWASVGRSWEHPRLRLHKTRDFTFSWGPSTVWFYRVADREPEGKRPESVADASAVTETFAAVIERTLHPESSDTRDGGTAISNEE